MVVIVGMFSLFIYLFSSSSSSLALQPFTFGFYTLSFFCRMSASRPTPILEGKFNFGMCSPMEVGKRLRPCSYSFVAGHSYLAPLLRPVRLEGTYQQPPALLEHAVLSLRFNINFRKGVKKWKTELQNLKGGEKWKSELHNIKAKKNGKLNYRI